MIFWFREGIAPCIALGTSLPEMSIALQAVRKKHYGIALGDALGANMTNLTLVLGVASVINPISVVLPVFIAALLFAIIANILLLYSASVKRGVMRKGGVVFLLIYILFILITISFIIAR